MPLALRALVAEGFFSEKLSAVQYGVASFGGQELRIVVVDDRTQVAMAVLFAIVFAQARSAAVAVAVPDLAGA